MRSSIRFERILLQPSSLRTHPRRHFVSSSSLSRAFQAGDAVLLRDRDGSGDGTLVRLKKSKIKSSHRGVIKHDDIIGKQPRQLVYSSSGAAVRIHEPTLAEYVRFTPRMVTPIYPSDANLIVSLLDLHVDTPPDSTASGPPLEILEAGTGHGALTLHLSRAIHAANPPLPRQSIHAITEDEPEDAVYLGESVSNLEEMSLDAWSAGRRAIVHTLDISSKHSKHARTIVEGFRQGMYGRNVDFHVGDISRWIASQKSLRATREPFLSHVFLDLPNAHHHLANVGSVLHVNGVLAVFNPSITQITECVEMIRLHKLPYLLDQVIELGAGTIRHWDIRAVRPRASVKGRGQEVTDNDNDNQSSSVRGDQDPADPTEGQVARDDELGEAQASQPSEQWAMVCRPKVGQRVIGGGFLALWRRMEPGISKHRPAVEESEVSEGAEPSQELRPRD